MRALILSDIHANLEALEAVLAAAAINEGYDEIWNLGDLVGYGASPNQVIERIRPLQSLVVRGNHDRVCCGLTSPENFNPIARAAALWTRTELSESNTRWLREVPQGPIHPTQHGVTCVHGSPLDEDHYILSMHDAWAPLQQMATPTTFFGHTHIQGAFSQQGDQWHETRPQFERSPDTANMAQSSNMHLAPGTRHLINPGSVGQPRDQDWRAAFAIFSADDCLITFYRIPYDLIASQGRILMAGLPERLAERLREGR